ncbi:MAG: amino acid ABC transporter permease [Pseudomonadota bacterium]
MSLAADAPGGPIAWVRQRLFATWFDGLVTVAFALFGVYLFATLFDWAIVNAVWTAEAREACTASAGACWAVVDARGRLILFGLYPREEHWRSALACVAIIATMGLSCVPFFWSMARLAALWLIGFGTFMGLMYGGFFGLPTVTTEQWGGLSLTVFLFSAGLVVGMPTAIGLALARRSRLPVVSTLAGIVIDFTRSIPLLALLFAAAVVMPLVLPSEVQGDKLTRVVIAFAFFYACYQAEIIRAGIQSVSKGQEEAAAALGMPGWSRVFDIVLPQAFRNTLPATINQTVITFKETSIVTIIGFFEVTSSASAAVGRGEWAAYFVEVYVFVALIYFTFAFALSRYGAYLERRTRLVRG